MEKEIILSFLNIKEEDFFNLDSLILMSISKKDITEENLYNLDDFLLFKKIELIKKIESVFNIEIKDEDLENLITLNDILNIIKQKQSCQNKNRF